ncbi:hypothetical protein GSI_14936 [Ganoderma sinense ZZ0214-1]|uniref:Uncharacterized protein n=1 Tax=Ganoderma sinense ZZ0214-1 TaxID=1077348 RepID=A0A2G8RQ47_9APHY|nr:hypothetical protein GSI_14936 [Ganoderma sinense ZZ0214-1]
MISSAAGGNLELNAPNSPGYQFLQARALILIENKIGLVAVLPIGMAQVSSVVLSVKEGDTVKKGQEIAFFQLGGSDVVTVMVFQKDAKVDLKEWKSSPVPGKPGLCEEFTKVGTKIGTATPFQAPSHKG